MLRSILVGLDGSVSSETAVQLGLQWAKQFSAQLMGLAVIDEVALRAPEPVPIGGGYFKVMKDEEQLADAHRAAEQSLTNFAEQCSRAGVAGKGRKLVGEACELIQCESQRSDLILLSQQTCFHHGAHQGSCKTLAAVVKLSPRPVVVVPERFFEGRSVVVGFDGSTHAARALQMFQLLELAGESTVHVVSIDADHAAAKRRVERAVDYLRLHKLEAAPVALASSASPAEVLLEEAERLHASLLVLGAYGKSALREFLLGSITQRLLQEVRIPLFLYH